MDLLQNFILKNWNLIKDRSTDFINRAQQTAFSDSKNTSVTTILYKDKGDTDDLKNSTAKWVDKRRTPIEWDKVWQSGHNPLSAEETTSFVWEQIHLNMYTTHSYNKWHTNTLLPVMHPDC